MLDRFRETLPLDRMFGVRGRFKGLGFVFEWPLLVGSLPFKFLFFRCQPTVASAMSPLRFPFFAFLAIDSVDELGLGGENSTGDVVKEVEEAARGSDKFTSNLRQAFASRISDIDGGEGDNGRHVERAVWIVRSGRRRC